MTYPVDRYYTVYRKILTIVWIVTIYCPAYLLTKVTRN